MASSASAASSACDMAPYMVPVKAFFFSGLRKRMTCTPSAAAISISRVTFASSVHPNGALHVSRNLAQFSIGRAAGLAPSWTSLYASAGQGGAITSRSQEDCQALLTAAMQFAERLLQGHGEFYPFGHAKRGAARLLPSPPTTATRTRPPATSFRCSSRCSRPPFQQGARRNKYARRKQIQRHGARLRVRRPSSGSAIHLHIGGAGPHLVNPVHQPHRQPQR